MKRALFLILLSLLATALCTPGAYAAKMIKFGHIMPAGHHNAAAAEAFKQKFEELTGGAYEVQIYHNGQLGDEKQLLESMKLGIGQMSLPNVAVVGNLDKNFSLLSLPFVFPSPEVALKVLDGPWGTALNKQLEPLGYVGLGYLEVGSRNVTNNVRPITRLEDFKGLKLRVMQNPVILNIFRALGANPTAMAWEEVFSAMQQNVIDGQENPIGHIPAFKLYEVQKYLSMTEHAQTMVSIVMAKEFYDAMPPADRQALVEAVAYCKQVHKKAKADFDAAALEEIKQSGMQVNQPDPAEMKRIRDTAMPQVEQEARKINAAMYADLLEAIKAVEAQ